eukprot:CAMPEP_0194104624 /NCGR_PEP_ID=MMETSP0150-20130528/4964_1 /TAXON_ID=122233 /ORGANISM="Chaetoceros debilis, Strain MM31A-1" /LENGTH=31 /DNA_ID= /DNA_START= /DNA_END= /DNA_ORIENTATION=
MTPEKKRSTGYKRKLPDSLTPLRCGSSTDNR